MLLEDIISDLNKNKYAQIEPSKDAHYLFSDEVLKAVKRFKPLSILVAYGSLAPNQLNHSKISHIPGKWVKGKVFGKLVKGGWGSRLGYMGFKATDLKYRKEIEAYMLFSENLEDYWASLDLYEGEGYMRIITKFQLENGTYGMGCIYELKGNIN